MNSLPQETHAALFVKVINLTISVSCAPAEKKTTAVLLHIENVLSYIQIVW